MKFHKNLKLPKRFFENKSDDFIKSDFIKPNHDKSNYSVSSFNSYDNNDNKIIKDNSLLIKIKKKNKIPLKNNVNIKSKRETIILSDDENNINKEDDIFNNSEKRLEKNQTHLN
jgi:hypothetical protein